LSRFERMRLYERTRAALERLKASDAEIADASREHHRFVLYDLSRPIAEKVDAALNAKVNERQKVVDAFPAPISDHAGYGAIVERWRDAASIRSHFQELARLANVESYADAG